MPTGIEKEEIEQIVHKFSSVPEGFNLHKGLEKTLKGMGLYSRKYDYMVSIKVDAICSMKIAWTGRLVRRSHSDRC